MASSEPLSSLKVGPQVRIRLPPAGSPLRTWRRRHGLLMEALIRCTVEIKAPFSAAVLRMLTPAASFSGGRGAAVTRVFSCRASGRQGNGEDMRRIGDVLQPLLSEIDEIGGYRSPHMTPDIGGDANGARRGEALEARRDIDPGAVNSFRGPVSPPGF